MSTFLTIISIWFIASLPLAYVTGHYLRGRDGQ